MRVPKKTRTPVSSAGRGKKTAIQIPESPAIRPARHQDAAGDAVPAGTPAPQAGHELERPEDAVERRADDVRDDRDGRGEEAHVALGDLGADGQLGQAHGAGDDRDEAQEDEADGDEASRAGPGAHGGCEPGNCLLLGHESRVPGGAQKDIG